MKTTVPVETLRKDEAAGELLEAECEGDRFPLEGFRSSGELLIDFFVMGERGRVVIWVDQSPWCSNRKQKNGSWMDERLM